MPRLSKLSLQNFRNIDSASLELSPSTNIVFGENGSGKTSLLESIAVLAHGKSFRTHKYRRLIKDEAESLTLFAELEEQGQRHKLGVLKHQKGKTQIRVNGENASSAAALAQRLPLLVMTTNSFNLLEGGPKLRRQFFDWLVFHVEHRFIEVWKAYARSLKQRNSLLRRGKIDYAQVKPWDQEIASLGRRLNELRSKVFQNFLNSISQLTEHYSYSHSLSFEFNSGWQEGEDDLEDQLFASFERDCKLGYTSIGCHKSDIKIRSRKVPAVEILSRGQQKLLITALFLASAQCFAELTERQAVFLIDDLAAELDGKNIGLMSEQISDLGAQVFLSAIESEALIKYWSAQDFPPKMFHVEHGRVKHHKH